MIDTLILFFALALVFFLPGWLLLRIFWPHQLTLLEQSLYAFVLGITLVDLATLVLDRLHIPLTTTVFSLVFGGCIIILNLVYWYLVQKSKNLSTPHFPLPTPPLSQHTWKILSFMFILTIGIKAYYLVPTGLPTATDMGHHMYWSQYITSKASLPHYQKIEVLSDTIANKSTLSEPKPIADFIIGEHIPFGVIATLTGLPVIGSFPVIMLLLINLLTLLAVLALTLRLGQSVLTAVEQSAFIIGTFLVLGPLFTLASPQAKFVSGGVVGNLFGNLFLPLILLAFYLGLTKRQSSLIALGTILMGTLMYTHHLSTLILGFLLLGIAVIALGAVWEKGIDAFKEWFKVFFQPPVGIVLLGILATLLLVAVPSYLDRTAIDSALGSPVKTTRTGLSFLQVSNSLGIVKTAFALAGFVLLLVSWKRFHQKDPLAWALILGWGGMLALMTLRPDFLFLDIPSNRVGSYLVYPTALLVGYALAQITLLITRSRFLWLNTLFLPVLLVLIIANGVFENGATLTDQAKQAEVQEVFTATRYLSKVTTENDIILKDHNYLPADAWMKLFFLRDYGYPLSRGLFSRYSDTGNRKERCTLVMIASPNGEEAKSCFDSTGTNYVVVNPTFDAVQFEKSPDFAKVYSSDHVAVFKRKE
ncbi:MAG: hypothetical protein E6P95_03730 [Candidatus Moraniibacteriota bacterium]|nr:MAG: hypothetical protein E6P95_03730 [Candidatus Moranbacteria bacterium]